MGDAQRFAVIEDHPLVRDALAARVRNRYPNAQIVYSGASLQDAVEMLGTQKVDCAILDLDLGDGRSPVLNTADLADAGSPVLIVSALADPGTVRACLRAGALGFVSKTAEADDFEAALEATLAGIPSTSRDLAAILYSEDSPSVHLSERERTAMVLYASGLKMDAVARRMGVKPGTASEYIKRVREKYVKAGTPLPTKTDLYKRAKEEGLLT